MPKDYDAMVNERIENGREYRDLVEFRIAEDTEDMVVEGYASTFNEPYLLYSEPGFRLYEQVAPEAFDDADMRDVIFQYDHAGRVFARLSNKTLSVAPDDHGLRVRAYLGGTDIGRELYQEIKGGYTTKMSFAFTVAEDKREIEENQETGDTTILRTITKVAKLYDVSAVSLPANPATTIAARTYGEGVIAEVKAERQRAAEEAKAIEELRARIRIMAQA